MAAVLKHSFLGIEIGDEAVRAVLVQARRGEEHIIAAHRAPREAGISEVEALTAALTPLFALEETATAVCAVSLPPGDFAFRQMTAPFGEDRKLRRILPLELEPSLAMPADEMVFDYRRLNDEHQPLILVAALAKSRLAGLLQELASLGIDPERVTVGGISGALLLAASPQGTGQSVVCELRPDGATVIPIEDGRVRTIRALPVAVGSDRGRQSFVAMLRQTLQAVATADGQPFRPDRIRITGYGDHSAALEALLAGQSDTAVQRIDLRQQIAGAPDSTAPNGWDPGEMNAALALALGARCADTGFNLRQGEFAVKKFWSRYRSQLRRTATLLALVILLAGADFAYGIYLKQRKLEGIVEQTTAVFKSVRPDATRVVDPVSQMRTAIEELKAVTLTAGTQGERPAAIDILAALSKEITAELDVEIDKLVIGTDNLVITGQTGAFNTVDEVKTRLEQHPMFGDVTIAAANIDKQSNRVRFTLNIARLEAAPWPSD